MGYKKSQAEIDELRRRKRMPQWKKDEMRIKRNQSRLCSRCGIYPKSSYYGDYCIWCGRRT